MKSINTALDNLLAPNKLIKKPNAIGLVIQHNSLVEAKYRLSLQEKRIVLWLLTQIKSDDEDFKLHKLEVSEFSKMTGLGIDNQYSKLQEITSNLMRRVFKIHEPQTDSFFQVSWLSFARYYLKKGYIELRFDPALKPYLLQLKSHFTKLNLSDMMNLNSIYTTRFYELLKQYESIGKRTIYLQKLREYCGIIDQEYKKYNDLKKNVLERAKKEINEKTDIIVDYIEIKESRKIVAIEWTIKKRYPEKQEHIEKIDRLEKELRSERIVVDSLLEYGFSKTTIKRFITLHGEKTVKDAIRAVDLQVERGKAKNPKAMIRTAIEEKWHPEIFKKKF
jgi:plasmid replication initiation protein